MPNKEQNINKNNEEKVSIQSQDQRGFFYRLFNKYKFTKKKCTDLETSAALDKDLSKDDQASTEEIPSYEEISTYLKSFLEEKNLLQQRNIEINSNNRTFFINYLNEKHRLNSNMPLSEETKAALIEDLDKFYYIPLKTSTCHNFIFDLNITRRELTRLKDDQFLKVNELIAQLTDDATIAITNKYQLLENHTVSEEKLEAIANEVMDLNLDEEMKRAVIAKLELLKEDRATLRKIYRKKQDTLKTQEKMYSNKLEKKLQKLHWERVSIATAISSKYLLSIEKTTPQEKLKAIANELMDLNPSEVQGIGKDIFHLLEMKTRDRKTLRTIYNELKKTQESQKYANIKAATLTITNIYELSKDQSNSPEKLNKIAKTIVDLDLSEEQKREVILELKIPEKDKATLREMYSDELEKNLNGERVSIAKDISSKYQLSVEKTTPQERLNTIAKKITKLDLSDEQKREVIRILEISEKDQDTLAISSNEHCIRT